MVIQYSTSGGHPHLLYHHTAAHCHFRCRLHLEELGDLQVSAQRKRALAAYPQAIFIEQERHRRKEECDAAEQHRRPVDAQVDEHLRREKQERRASRGADDGVAHKCRCRVQEVRVHKVTLFRRGYQSAH